MNLPLIIAAWWVLCQPTLTAEQNPPATGTTQHQQGAAQVADDQDELAADVQQLTIEQTEPKVIKLLDDVKSIMHEASDRLAKADTGGETLAAQTEIIEKIHTAAKEKQNQGGGGQSGSAMMDMMERMLGKSPAGESPGKGPGGSPTAPGSNDPSNSSAPHNQASKNPASGKNQARRVPKAAGSTTVEIPAEFKPAFDAYNRGAEQKIK